VRSVVVAPLRHLRGCAHPLYLLRRLGPTRALLRSLDRPMWAQIKCLPWPVRVRLVSHMSFLVLGTPEPQVVETFQRIVRERNVRIFCDVGANFGYYSWLVKALQPAARVILLEPEPLNLELIAATVERNQLQGVRVVAAAASAAGGTAVFHRDPDGAFQGSLEFVATGRATIDVQLMMLDDLEERVDLIKIDVEGHEPQVLAGAERIVAEHRPAIVLECLAEDMTAVRWLEDRGYESTRIDVDNYLLTPRE